MSAGQVEYDGRVRGEVGCRVWVGRRLGLRKDVMGLGRRLDGRYEWSGRRLKG